MNLATQKSQNSDKAIIKKIPTSEEDLASSTTHKQRREGKKDDSDDQRFTVHKSIFVLR